jgi:hypothetical protein
MKTIRFLFFFLMMASGVAAQNTDSLSYHNSHQLSDTSYSIVKANGDSTIFLFEGDNSSGSNYRTMSVNADSTQVIWQGGSQPADTLEIWGAGVTSDSINNNSSNTLGWGLNGNSIADSNFIGTTNDAELLFKVNNILAGRTGKGSFSNTSFGAKSQPITGTGLYNASFGSLASASLLSGAKNTDIGYEAGLNNLSGNFNTRVGEGANIWDTSSSYNAVLGTEALNYTSLTKISGGGYNTALGSFALNRHAAYRGNIGLGFWAGNGLTGNNTLFVSDSAYHMYFKLDSASGSPPSVVGKDASGYWHVYQPVSGGTAFNADSLGGQPASYYLTTAYIPTWAEISGKPTTLSGYGITDGISGSGSINYFPKFNTNGTIGSSGFYQLGNNMYNGKKFSIQDSSVLANAAFRAYTTFSGLWFSDHDSSFNLNTTFGNVMNLNKNGNVGINNSAPTQKLDVVGNVKATSFIKSGGTSSQFLKADGSSDATVYSTDANVVHLSGNETITGAKTLPNSTVINTNFSSAKVTFNSGLSLIDTAADNTAFLHVISGTPSIVLYGIRPDAVSSAGIAFQTSTGGVGLHYYEKTKLWDNGILATMISGAGNSILSYQYLGAGSDASYTNNNLRLYPDKTVGLQTVNDAAGDFVTRNASTGLITRRTAGEVATDLATTGTFSKQGFSHGDNSVLVSDTRTINNKPHDRTLGIWFDFKQLSTIGLSGGSYGSLITMNPYTDNSGSNFTAFRLAQNNNNLYLQDALNDSTWSSWSKLLSTTNFIDGTDYLTPSSAASTYQLKEDQRLSTINNVHFNSVIADSLSTNNTNLFFRVKDQTAGQITYQTQNTVLGSNALNLTTTGNAISVFGANSLPNNTTGVYNSVFGGAAMVDNAIGSHNTAIGLNSLFYNKTGNYNTALGEKALFFRGVNNSYNIGIGYDAGSNADTSLSNTLFISDNTNHMRYLLDSTTGPAPSIIGKDANGFWHVYQLPEKSLSGTATLTSGTVTVSTTLVKAGAKIFVSINTPSGTQGFLSAPTSSIVDGTSFVINSTSTTENSTVNWQIINP